ncbi:uncharacterized protein LOC122182128 [Lagopus leucura]|uniref:uncharacterized protein LOC122182128 n=1 Tax=Lagopus leucura TaxID=30410 RepID=UPI001C67C161|nr:uncharacterized protein LOC122182128 [Lagopus leucura]
MCIGPGQSEAECGAGISPILLWISAAATSGVCSKAPSSRGQELSLLFPASLIKMSSCKSLEMLAVALFTLTSSTTSLPPFTDAGSSIRKSASHAGLLPEQWCQAQDLNVIRVRSPKLNTVLEVLTSAEYRGTITSLLLTISEARLDATGFLDRLGTLLIAVQLKRAALGEPERGRGPWRRSLQRCCPHRSLLKRLDRLAVPTGEGDSALTPRVC